MLSSDNSRTHCGCHWTQAQRGVTIFCLRSVRHADHVSPRTSGGGLSLPMTQRHAQSGSNNSLDWLLLSACVVDFDTWWFVLIRSACHLLARSAHDDLTDMGFTPCKNEPDIWLREHNKDGIANALSMAKTVDRGNDVVWEKKRHGNKDRFHVKMTANQLDELSERQMSLDWTAGVCWNVWITASPLCTWRCRMHAWRWRMNRVTWRTQEQWQRLEQSWCL